MKPETMLQQLQQHPDFLKLTLSHADFLPFASYQLKTAPTFRFGIQGLFIANLSRLVSRI